MLHNGYRMPSRRGYNFEYRVLSAKSAQPGLDASGHSKICASVARY